MNKLEASVSLFIITFFCSIQYAFIAGVPESVSQFAYLTVTNAIGFIIMLLFFFGELFRIDKKQVFQSFILSLELVAFNVFLVLGSSKVGATVCSCLLSAYFAFVPPLGLILFREKPDWRTFPGIFLVLIGLFLMMDADFKGLLNMGTLYLILADIAFALYILSMGRYSSTSNPSIIAMGQVFFSLLISLGCWIVQVLFFGKTFALPTEPSFWVCAIYISFFIRGIYTIVQLYAMRYVSALETSLIFSTEIIMTMFMSPVLALVFSTKAEEITIGHIIAAGFMIAGVLAADSSVQKAFSSVFTKMKNSLGFLSQLSLSGTKTSFMRWMRVSLMVALVYVMLDFMVQKAGFLQYSSIVGLKNFLPPLVGVLWGLYGALGTAIGSLLSSIILGVALSTALAEILCNFLIASGMWLAWHVFNASVGHTVTFKTWRSHLVYSLSLVLLSFLSAIIASLISDSSIFMQVFCSYLILGLLLGVPLCIIFGSTLCVENVIPVWYLVMPDLACIISGMNEKDAADSDQTLAYCNEKIEETASYCGIPQRRIFEMEGCIEELFLRVKKALPDAVLYLVVKYGSSISLRITYSGEFYNPFRLEKDEDMLDIASLKLLRHRALRVSAYYKKREHMTHIHIVI
ncbi:DMT family transporter [Treponema ruminis]|uniref:Drug/metabolite transporter (DMT)-like permease n=1 Tax=Treponema ruminis TaxID=744515 RepID=A0A7W8LLK4_9SPIR|nr:DMT family transporter [Treponema ruminis]MBB5225438.1 drug/metabolite transporter (DMT)-like permease [Treponema ruminis]QSI01693.1 DMT family transporter [Treponema ruminis]